MPDLQHVSSHGTQMFRIIACFEVYCTYNGMGKTKLQIKIKFELFCKTSTREVLTRPKK